MARPTPQSPRHAQSGEVLPLAREELKVATRKVETGRVRVVKRVREREVLIAQPLLHEVADVERTPVNRAIDEPPAPRYEGEVLVIPIVEEVLVVRKQLMLREELRIRRRVVEKVHRGRARLRSEEPVVERVRGRTPSRRMKQDGGT